MSTLSELLQLSAVRHDHLCPRQVLGVRMGLAGLEAIGVGAPISKPTGLIIVETDGCFVDGIEVASGASVGHRTLRVVDMGKIAATFVNVQAARSVRLAPRAGIRTLAFTYAPGQDGRYAAQLEGYKVMPVPELFSIQEVGLTPPLAALLSRPEARAICSNCGEEVINERELRRQDLVLCHACAGKGYYKDVNSRAPAQGRAAGTTERP